VGCLGSRSYIDFQLKWIYLILQELKDSSLVPGQISSCSSTDGPRDSDQSSLKESLYLKGGSENNDKSCRITD
jgi:hypothetical protein